MGQGHSRRMLHCLESPLLTTLVNLFLLLLFLFYSTVQNGCISNLTCGDAASPHTTTRSSCSLVTSQVETEPLQLARAAFIAPAYSRRLSLAARAQLCNDWSRWRRPTLGATTWIKIWKIWEKLDGWVCFFFFLVKENLWKNWIISAWKYSKAHWLQCWHSCCFFFYRFKVKFDWPIEVALALHLKHSKFSHSQALNSNTWVGITVKSDFSKNLKLIRTFKNRTCNSWKISH